MPYTGIPTDSFTSDAAAKGSDKHCSLSRIPYDCGLSIESISHCWSHATDEIVGV